ncbi:glycoside hydrolase family 3 N-terminal domain-containing protein [Roseateles sp. LYH14W]|uniref:beta-glucosidase n=1 Tax=Pelomonas parva TaxID=3299032 RepID=A0ABW7F8M6_9BURK
MSKAQIKEILGEMSLSEKIGQLCQVQPHGRDIDGRIRAGEVGSVINAVGDDAYHFQWLAVEQSRLRIPLLIGRDVIHGFNTIFPIPLGQAASFDPCAVRKAAELAALESATAGVNWTFSPMLDIARDPRWGRIAESFGEDTLLGSIMGCAMVEGYQLAGIAACAKHFVGYGAAEGGRDYSQANITERQLRDTYLPPFQAAVMAGAMSVMTAFNELDGVPMSGHRPLIVDTLKKAWGFDGLVVSDWNSIIEMITHGFARDEAEAAAKALHGGVDMEMASGSFLRHLPLLLESGQIGIEQIDEAVSRVLRIKFELGLFEQPYGRERQMPALAKRLELARSLARDSCVLLKNDGVLPLRDDLQRVAVVGPMADAPGDQLGCWVFDADHGRTTTVLAAIRQRLGEPGVAFEPGLASCRDVGEANFAAAEAAVRGADVAIVCLGEDAGLSGEAHCRAHLGLPGAQARLLEKLAATGTPVVVVLFTGRPLVLAPTLQSAGALLLAWHPGSEGGPAITDLLFGESPSGRLPVSMPRSEGQIPVYYGHKNTGRPPSPNAPSIPSGTPLDPTHFCAAYLDEDHRPLFPFGFGLSYTRFEYDAPQVKNEVVPLNGVLLASVRVTNVGAFSGTETVQLYVRDLCASVTRPVTELKAFKRITLSSGQCETVEFEVPVHHLSFHDAAYHLSVEPGDFHLWLTGDSASGTSVSFRIAPQ